MQRNCWEKIFSFMNEMVDTKDFASTILLLTELGRTLANSERASFWYWDKCQKSVLDACGA